MLAYRRLPLVLLLSAAAAFAQSAAGTGNISGVVRDASGSSIPGAKVVVANAALGITRTLNTNESGVFTAGSLVPSPGYSVMVTSQGFTPWELKDAVLAVGQTINLNVNLAVMSSTTQVFVSTVAPIVE